MDTPGLQTPIPPVQPETPVIAPPKKKFPLKIAAGVLMVFLLAAGVFVTDRIALQRQIIESQGKTAKMKPKDVEKKEDCGGAWGGGWQVWRGGGCKITGISGDPLESKNTEDPMAKQASTSLDCQNRGGFWCEGPDARGNAFRFCNTTGKACYQEAIKQGYSMSVGDCKNVKQADSVWYCKGRNAEFGGGCQGKDALPGGAGWDGEKKTIKGSFCGIIQVDQEDGPSCSVKDISGCDQEATAAEALPSPSPSPSPNVSCIDLTSNKTAPTMGDTVNFTCKADFSAAAPVAIFRHNISGGSYTESAQLPLNSSGEAGYSLTVNQTGNWSVQCRVCTDSTATTCTAWGQAN